MIAKVEKVELVSNLGSNFLNAILTFSQTSAIGNLKSNDQPLHALVLVFGLLRSSECAVRTPHTMKPRLSSPAEKDHRRRHARLQMPPHHQSKIANGCNAPHVGRIIQLCHFLKVGVTGDRAEGRGGAKAAVRSTTGNAGMNA
ncbi:hypothetical protein [Mesorhizobium sp. M1342]|uniref:hypothetical protein n=1 Tax=Mesorhizobium sp. M1342 TaxID=2957088 RepID=UPI00333B69B9